MIEVKPTTLKQANAYVEAVHRHHGRVVGHKWSLAAFKDGRLCGVAIVGRPTGRRLDDGNTLEVTRLCTDGTRNACSALYAACARRAKREGYGKIITFTLQSEPGTSLKAAGWTLEAEKAGKPRWNKQRYAGRPTQLSLFPEKQPPAEYKKRWAKVLTHKEDITPGKRSTSVPRAAGTTRTTSSGPRSSAGPPWSAAASLLPRTSTSRSSWTTPSRPSASWA